MEFMLQLPEVQLVKTFQGWYGAPSSKPTELFALRLQSLERRLREGVLTTKAPKGASLGVDGQGCFKTTRLKEYPPGLCKSFAHAIFDSVNRVEVASNRVPPEDFLLTCKKLEASLYSNVMGHDFMNLN